MNLGNFVLRDAGQKDVEGVLSFYEKNRTKNNAVREAEQLLRAIDDRQLLVVVNQHNNEICAASGSFRYEAGNYVEIGATFVTPDLRGFKTQVVTIWIHSLWEAIVNPDFYRLFAVVRADNIPSIHNLRQAGFTDASPDAVVSRLKNLTEKCYFELPQRHRYRHARMLLELEGAASRHRRNGDTLSLELDIGVLHPEWRHIIHALAAFDK